MIKAEWTNADALNLQPTCNQLATDAISRQAAIDEVDEWIKAFRENGHKESAADACLIQDGIIQLPSAQPEIIRCKDCKHHSHDAGYGYDWCNRTSGVFRVKPEDFCSRAERRTDEQIRGFEL